MAVMPWEMQSGRDLDPLPVEAGRWQRIVACLNVWNDLAELRANIESWYPHVDHVIAVDGAYRGMQCRSALSDDGTREFLRALPHVTLLDAEWLPQHEKRSLYFEHAQPGDLLWRIDADEHFENAAAIRETPHLDVGWLRFTAPIYSRIQGIPAVFAHRPGLRYKDRHHWVYDHNRLISTQQIGGRGLVHRLLPITMHNSRGAERPAGRVSLAKAQRREQVAQEAKASPLRVQGHEPLRVLQLGMIDPGIVIARLHSAINTTTPHTSLMATHRDEWTEPPRQLSIRKSGSMVRKAAESADVLHLHLNYETLRRIAVDRKKHRKHIVIHHHGTLFRRLHEAFAKMDAERATLRIVSNLELLQYGDNLHYLPNPVPFAMYRTFGDARRPAWKHGALRIAHSPTKRANKGTEAFLAACGRISAKGLAIEPVLIERLPWPAALALKATCHATFDSFWLGLQCSGLEAAAMGQPVIAGDLDCQREYRQRHGFVPYTFAADGPMLELAIERMATDEEFYHCEALRVGSFVREHHDYAAVADTYLEMLDGALHWREKLTLGRARVTR